VAEISDAERAARSAYARDAARRLARRWSAVAAAATVATTYAAGVVLRHDLGATTVSAVLFATLFGGTAWFVGHEVATWRRCPRCGWQQESRPGPCPSCGYDVGTRPRWICEEGHASLDPGLCHCGRRLHEWQPPDVSGRVLRMVWWGMALLVALVITRLILGP
jgi:hypothetical protein